MTCTSYWFLEDPLLVEPGRVAQRVGVPRPVRPLHPAMQVIRVHPRPREDGQVLDLEPLLLPAHRRLGRASRSCQLALRRHSVFEHFGAQRVLSRLTAGEELVRVLRGPAARAIAVFRFALPTSHGALVAVELARDSSVRTFSRRLRGGARQALQAAELQKGLRPHSGRLLLFTAGAFGGHGSSPRPRLQADGPVSSSIAATVAWRGEGSLSRRVPFGQGSTEEPRKTGISQGTLPVQERSGHFFWGSR